MRNLLANASAPSSMRVEFERPFVTPPKVVTFFNHIDLDKSKSWRLNTTATDIDTKGFTINVNTWGDTILYAAQAGWIAYPEDQEHIFSVSVNTQEVRPWNKPQTNQSKSITFGDVEFWKTPQVFVAFNQFDIETGHNFRLDAHVDNTTKTGLTWHINTWFDTVLYSAGASIIAVN